MKRLEYELEFITPAFIGGANPQEAELRPASIVGMLRWWFRVLVGAWVNNTEELFKLESELFGSQERAGKVWVRVKGLHKFTIEGCEEWDVGRPDRGRPGKDSGKAYLGYGNILFINLQRQENLKRYPFLQTCLNKGKNKGTFTVRSYIPTNSSFGVSVLVPEDKVDFIESLLFIVSQLGTIGSRSRRGWGSFILKPKYKSGYEIWDRFSPEELKKAIAKLSKEKNSLEIYIYGSYSDPMSALEDIGMQFRAFRSRRNPDYTLLKDFLSKPSDSNKEKLKRVGVLRTYFGLPINFRFSSLEGKQISITAKVGKDDTRLASPVRFKVIPNKNSFSVLIIHHKLKEFPYIIVKTQSEKFKIDKNPDSSIFYDFLNHLKNVRRVM